MGEYSRKILKYIFRFSSRVAADILLISRSNWQECNQSDHPCYGSYSGVIIYDNNRRCEADTLMYRKSESCFKPSFPNNDLL